MVSFVPILCLFLFQATCRNAVAVRSMCKYQLADLQRGHARQCFVSLARQPAGCLVTGDSLRVLQGVEFGTQLGHPRDAVALALLRRRCLRHGGRDPRLTVGAQLDEGRAQSGAEGGAKGMR